MRRKVPGLAKRLKQARALEDMTQWEVAAQTKMTVPEISRYELGLREPNLVSLIKLAKALGVTTDWLLKGKEQDDEG